MDCWPVKLVGTFFLALIVYDFIEAKWEQVPRHTVIGVLLTGLFLGLCALIGESISGAILVIPTIMLGIFLFATYILKKGLEKKGCCIKCTGYEVQQASQTQQTSQTQDTNKTSLTLTGEDECGKLTLKPVV